MTASVDGTARVWNVDDGSTIAVLRGHVYNVMTARFSPDGERVVTSSAEGTARLWNADGSGGSVVLRATTSPLFAAIFSPDGRRVMTASGDGTARVWPVAWGDILRSLSSATSACLTILDRPRFLGERESDARARHDACEAAHGRAAAGTRPPAR